MARAQGWSGGMPKVIAVINVVSWAGFWAFGYIALTTKAANAQDLMIATLLAFAGLISGVAAYLWIARYAEATGYARRKNRAVRFEEDDMMGDV